MFISCQNQADTTETQQPKTAQTQQTPAAQPQSPPAVVETPPVAEKPPEPETPAQQLAGTAPVPPPAPVFDPSSISKEEKDTAMTEISQLIQRLNGIIRAKNYNSWVSYLDPNYFAVISSADYLDRISQSAVLVKQKIVLKSAQDYFTHVVVPARANDRVDDIEFESHTRVKAYTINNRGEKLRLYDLEKTGNEWKIIN